MNHTRVVFSSRPNLFPYLNHGSRKLCCLLSGKKSYVLGSIWIEGKRAGMNEVSMTPTIFLCLVYTLH